jgi:adenylate kinase family enzyme
VSKFVIIRGPCGAGKSTVARRLFEQVTRPTALVERDRYMFMFRAPGGTHVPDKELIELDILKCFERGFDVIFEGNFRPGTHRDLLERLFSQHPDDNYVFYLDVSLEETLRRHGTRERIISEPEMRALYEYAVPLGHASESIVPEHFSIEEAVAHIRRIADL